MNAKTKLSAKGQVVIPKDVRDHLNLKAGQTLDVIETAGGVLLRPTTQKSGRTFEEVTAEIRKIMGEHADPPLSIEEIDEAAKEAWRKSALDSMP